MSSPLLDNENLNNPAEKKIVVSEAENLKHENNGDGVLIQQNIGFGG